MAEFKSLFLDFKLFPEEIHKFALLQDCEVIGPIEKPKYLEYKIAKTGQPSGLLHVYLMANECITLNFKVGTNVDLSSTLATHLAEKCMKTKFEQKPLSLKSITQKDWDFLIQYLVEHYGFVSKTRVEPNGVSFEISGSKLKPVYLIRYNNGRFLMQGKALEIYGIIASLLCELVADKSMVITAQIEAYSIEGISPESLSDELNNLMPTSFDFIGPTLQAIISSSLAFAKLNVDLPDYSGFAYPAIRGLEGYVKLLLAKYNYPITEQAGFADKFNKRILKESVKDTIRCPSSIEAIERSYDLYSIHRHGLFHVDANPETSRILETKEKAVSLIYEIIGLIEKTFSEIPNKP